VKEQDRDGGRESRRPRPDLGCSAIDDDDDDSSKLKLPYYRTQSLYYFIFFCSLNICIAGTITKIDIGCSCTINY
jgi:hypothetical protein